VIETNRRTFNSGDIASFLYVHEDMNSAAGKQKKTKKKSGSRFGGVTQAKDNMGMTSQLLKK
jgi:hypothetical protein